MTLSRRALVGAAASRSGRGGHRSRSAMLPEVDRHLVSRFPYRVTGGAGVPRRPLRPLGIMA